VNKYILVNPENKRRGAPPSVSNEYPVYNEKFYVPVESPVYVVVSKFAADETLRKAAQMIQP
jgi:hypothetical protein